MAYEDDLTDDASVVNYDDAIDNNNNWMDSETGISFYFVIFLSLLALVLILSNLLHKRPKLVSKFPEAGMTILVGIMAGYCVSLFAATPNQENDDAAEDDNMDNDEQGVADGLLSFSSTTFFVLFLPPIIFNSGYNLKPELFFRHIKPIALFACVGTVISAIVVAVTLSIASAYDLTGDFHPSFTELLTFGALISATDPVTTLAVFQTKRVDPHLFHLVFGESVLNDAVGLVLFQSIAKFVGNEKNVEKVTVALFGFLLDFAFIFSGSFVLGIISGVGAGFLLKRLDMRNTAMLELALFLLVMYLPFFFAEIFRLSGIVTILFTGISAKRYAVPNLSSSTETQADILFRVTAHLAETSIFLELGLSVFGISSFGNFHWQFVLWALFACLLGRALHIYPITFAFNKSIQMSDEEKSIELTNKTEFKKVFSKSRDEGLVGSDQLGTPLSTEDNEGLIDEQPSYESFSLDNPFAPKSRRDLNIGWNTANMLWFSGLRGAVAYACSKDFPDSNNYRSSFVVTTMIIVLVTVFLLGGTTEATLTILGIPMDVDEDAYMEEKYEQLPPSLLKRFETKYILPCVIRDYSPSLGEEEMHKDEQTAQEGGNLPSIHTSSPQQKGRVELDDVDAVRQSMRYQSNDGYSPRKKSVYDYGVRA